MRKLLPLIITTIIFIITMSLGTWQLLRLEYKRKIIKEIERQDGKDFEKTSCKEIKYGDFLSNKYKKVLVTGRIEGSPAYLYSQSPKAYLIEKNLHKYPEGYNLIYKFKCSDKEEIILDYGWVNSSDKKIEAPKGNIEIKAWVMPEDRKKQFITNNKKDSNIWFWVEFDKISEYLKINNTDAKKIYLMKSYKIADYPVGNVLTKTSIRNDHLYYAMTWYAMGLAAAAVYFIYIRGKKNGK